jgi:hypothetical protein
MHCGRGSEPRRAYPATPGGRKSDLPVSEQRSCTSPSDAVAQAVGGMLTEGSSSFRGHNAARCGYDPNMDAATANAGILRSVWVADPHSAGPDGGVEPTGGGDRGRRGRWHGWRRGAARQPGGHRRVGAEGTRRLLGCLSAQHLDAGRTGRRCRCTPAVGRGRPRVPRQIRHAGGGGWGAAAGLSGAARGHAGGTANGDLLDHGFVGRRLRASAA